MFNQPVHDIHTPDAAAEATRVLTSSPEVALDLEADSMHAFRARLCFMQAGTDADIYLFDALEPGVDVTRLSPLLADASRTKFLHAAGNDLQYLAEHRIRVAGLFDTHLAATWLGWPKVGLADLVQQIAGATLSKEHQQADFSIRPLPPELRIYIADDVRYLSVVGRAVREACAKADILDEVELACRRQCEEALARPTVAPLNVKLPAGLSPHEKACSKAVAEALHEARLRWAEAADVPMGQMLSNMAIADLAVRPPGDLRSLSQRKGVRGAFVREHGAEALGIIRTQIEKARRGELPLVENAPRPDPAIRKREQILKTFRTERAEARKVTPWVVLTNAHVDALSASPPRTVEDLSRIAHFGDKRANLYGQAIVELLRGR